MPKHAASSPRRKLAMVAEKRNDTLDTLANNGAKLITTKLAITSDFWMNRVEVFCRVKNLTSGEGRGLFFGLANGDLSAPEIAEAIVVNGPLNGADRIKEERAKRAVWLISQLEIGSLNTTGKFRGANGGPMMVLMPKWMFTKNEGWNWFIFNGDGALTTGSNARVTAKSFGNWA